MANYPAQREIPAGKILLAEYGSYGAADRAQISNVIERFSKQVRATVCLMWSSPGFEPAGSVARWTNGFWAVRWHDGSAYQGRRYSPTDDGETKAREHLARLTEGFDCLLCGQHIVDFKPCGCGAR